MDQIQIVSRHAIPPMQSVEPDIVARELRELRDFRWNTQLREFMPASSRVSVRWVRLAYGEVLSSPAPGAPSLLVLYAGGGTLVGDVEQQLVKDDVVSLPAGCRYGFIGGPNGLQAVLIQLGDEA